MAVFNWHIQSYRKGRATSQSDYIWRRNNFNSRDDLVATGCGNLPHWCNGDPGVFFSAADVHERKNGAACRHLVVALPRELNAAQRVGLIEKLVATDLGPKPYQYAVHEPASDSPEHPHAHIVYSDRVPDGHDRHPQTFFSRHNRDAPERGGCKKDSGGKSGKQLRLEVIGRKKRWAELQNEALEAAGHDVRVEYQSGK